MSSNSATTHVPHEPEEKGSKPHRASISDDDEGSTDSLELHGKSNSGASADSDQDAPEGWSANDAERVSAILVNLQHKAERRVSRGSYSHALKTLSVIPESLRTPAIQACLAAIYNARSEHAWHKADRERYAAAARELMPVIEADAEAARVYAHVTSQASSDPKLLVQAVLDSEDAEDVKKACKKLGKLKNVEANELIACANRAYTFRFPLVRQTLLLYRRASELYEKRGLALAPREFARYAYCTSWTKPFHGVNSLPVENFQRIIAETPESSPMHAWAEHELAVLYHRCFIQRHFTHCHAEALKHYDLATRAASLAPPSDQLALEVSRCSNANAEKARGMKIVTFNDAWDDGEGEALHAGNWSVPESIPAP